MSSKKEKLSSSKFQNLIITDSKSIIGGADVTTSSEDRLMGTSIFRDINPDPCTKWRCDSTCYCSDVSTPAP